MGQLEPPYGLILDFLRQGLVIPFLGSGASLAGHEPKVTWEAFPAHRDVDRPIHHLVDQHFAQSYVGRLLAIPF